MTINGKKTVQVAIAILAFGEQLLLATRKDDQHQGGKLEFVGGKIEPNETPMQALKREICEEIGLDITDNLTIKLGRIYHDYPEVSVCLHVFYVVLSQNSYQVYQHRTQGSENQSIGFYDKSWVIDHADRFPAANRRILQWLLLPDVIVISLPLSDFADEQCWLSFYAKKLTKNQLFYPRLQTDTNQAIIIIQKLLKLRPDLRIILPMQLSQNTNFYHLCEQKQVVAITFGQNQLMNFESYQIILRNLPKKLFYLASCHDAISIEKANDIAKNYSLIGVFVSPVKPTKTHPDSQTLGLNAFKNLTKKANMPVIALGGLVVDDLPQVQQRGGFCVSGIRGFV